jgi:exopolysaccharide biosynthesis predicted pyruvyltransferase EpsI
MTFLEFLEKNATKKIFVDPCSGNNGDLLIWQGMLEALSKKNISVVEAADQAELIIINGGGMFIDAYKQGINKIATYTEKYPNVPLCVAPNSFYFTVTDFAAVLRLRTSELTLFVREKYSSDYLFKVVEPLPLVSAHLDEDLAFQLIGSDFIADIKAEYPNPTAGKVLVCDRMDIEHAKSKGRDSLLKKIYMMFVPGFVKASLRKIRFWLRSKTGTEFTDKATKIILSNNPKYVISEIVTSDISRVDICDFPKFIENIATSEYIFTNRLHVGVLGHLLGRNVFMMEGSYHKMTGIYEQSMQHATSTQIIRD